MTDDGRFLSRRERRAQEEREATPVPADTDALSLGPISESIPTHAPDGRLLSRRERRRLERMRQPMETWTAEEEMIATGQIPAMTPERIAEQEKLARERAAQAQREAEQASAELQGIAEHPEVAAAEPVEVPSAQPPWAPVTQASDQAQSEPEPWQPAVTDTEQASSAPEESAHEPATPEQTPGEDPSRPARASLIAAVAADVNPVEPETAHAPATWDEQAVPAEPAVAADQEFPTEQEAPTDGVEPPPGETTGGPAEASVFEPTSRFDAPEQTPAPGAFEPEAELDAPAEGSAAPADQPHVEVDSQPPASASSAPAAPDAAVPGMPPGMSPEMFASLFPPGSLQRRLMEDQAAAEKAAQEEAEDPAAEIRRLAQEAVAGLDATSQFSRAEPTQAEQTSFAHEGSAPDLEPPASWDSAARDGFDPAPTTESPAPWEMPAPTSQSAPQAGESDSAPPTFSVPTFDTAEEQPSEPERAPEHPADQQAPSAEPSAPPAPASAQEEAPFDAIVGGHPDAAALDQAANTVSETDAFRFHNVGTDAPPQAEQPPQEVHGFSPAPGASAPWGEHPLSQVEREAPELPEMPPAQSVTHPDLSGVGFRPQASHPGPVPIVEPVPTGQIEVPPRARPELTGADVPRSFKWAHLAVFGAVGLLLGVIVWQVA